MDRKAGVVAPPDTTITSENWTEHVGQEKLVHCAFNRLVIRSDFYFDRYYVSFVTFFKSEVERLGPASCLEDYVFSPRANGNETRMLLRFAGGA